MRTLLDEGFNLFGNDRPTYGGFYPKTTSVNFLVPALDVFFPESVF